MAISRHVVRGWDMVRPEGHEVGTVHDGAAAVAAFQPFHPEVALLDIGMPRFDGHEVARRIRQPGQERS